MNLNISFLLLVKSSRLIQSLICRLYRNAVCIDLWILKYNEGSKRCVGIKRQGLRQARGILDGVLPVPVV